MPCELDCMLGGSVFKKDYDRISTESFTGSGKVVGLYFSAQWCPPGRSFTPVLAEKYRRWKKEHPEFEIVFISSDRTAVDFVTYFNEMPWLAIPFDQKDVKAFLSIQYGVTVIPTLIIVNGKTGEIVTKDGRKESESYNFPTNWKC